MIGIYKIKNKINGKVYIGQSVNIERRWHSHKYANCKSSAIYSAIKKYGIENFSFKVIEECSIEELNDKEMYWINFYDSTNSNKGYNLNLGGAGTREYNYEEIYNLWLSGLRCKDIQTELNCNDQVITNALRVYGINEHDAKSRSQKSKEIVALDIDTEKPLKIFKGEKSILIFFNKKEGSTFIHEVLNKDNRTAYGYRWQTLNDKNIPLKEISDEEFLSYQKYSKRYI